MNLDETLDFHRNLAAMKGIVFEELDNAKNKDFTKNKPEENNDQAIAFGIDGVKCTRVRENMSLLRSSIFK